MNNYQEKISKLNQENNIVLYMKGSQDFPQCGFSAMTCQILNNLGVEFLDINVLQDMDLRQAIKEYSDWPTIPQLYIKNEFIGGCDIVKEMAQSGELESLLKSKSLL
ncbi:Grx4 family monothiol glutaredoxin [Rickettsiales bacterium]|jgi:monothiol glutaredoxin|nr:Grx4 family monothiol glutaredoxin [Rickettsiales bacterium]|tara:strand:+ start:6094 stop:6414 length:321 start_codon:yes stop_codon:yes gene_type:complete